jgi:hypothetical protein
MQDRTILDQLRAAFDGDDVPRKNVALRRAHDEISRLEAKVSELRSILNDCTASLRGSYDAR